MLSIYNSLSKKKEVFEPIEAGKVKIYVCGPTVYDACHIGHARSAVVFDVMVRYLKVVGYEVTYVRNFTDVDDKIINRAKEVGITPRELAARYIEAFYQDMDALKVERATLEPKATDHIDAIIRVIQLLMEQGHAYEAGGHVFYAVDTFPGYGKLSGRQLEDMHAGARVAVNENKRNPFDFALWKKAKPGEPMWDSPWGMGRPGWHIECSAMSTLFLGHNFDIHGGGQDLIFPHHENEIAQSEGAFKVPFANFWVHNGFVKINQEKMSKSLGNFRLIRDMLKQYHPEAIRLFLLSNHYRSPVDFTEQAMAEAEASLEKIYVLLERIEKSLGGDLSYPDGKGSGPMWSGFRRAMDDDFNTARALGLVFENVRQLNRLMDDDEKAKDRKARARQQDFVADLKRVAAVLGIATQTPTCFFEDKKAKALEGEVIDTASIERLIAERNQARKRKDWARADQIREELALKNIVLEDRPEGTVWKAK
jgi:cysteinyl-tRNA synthetase